MNNGDIVIVETKGGEFRGKSKNIDKNVINKFESFKDMQNKIIINLLL